MLGFCLAFFLPFAANALDVGVSYAVYTTPDKPYVEVNIEVAALTITYKKVDSTQMQAGVETIIMLKQGDKVKVRIEIRVDRQMEYVHLKDLRAAGLEPVNVLSGYRWQGGLGYYESTKDLATHFFIDYLPKGTFVFEYPLVVSLKGDFSNGITTMQCMYAPEFTSHSKGVRVKVE